MNMKKEDLNTCTKNIHTYGTYETYIIDILNDISESNNFADKSIKCKKV